MPRMRVSIVSLTLVCLAAACGGGGDERRAAAPASSPPAATEPEQPRRDALAGGPHPALLVTQAHFVERVGADGKKASVPGPARLVIVRDTGSGWKQVVVDDPDSNVMHKAVPWDGGVLTIAANQAMLRVWRFANGAWTADTHWNPKFGGRFDRLRDFETGDVDGDGKDEIVIATHDQGVIAVVHPDEGWKVDEVDRTPTTFVHEIEIGDIDGDGTPEFFATPSKPNKLDQEQPGEVVMFRRDGDGWTKSVVDAPGDTHAKEILATDVDGDGTSELYVVWEGAVGEGGTLLRPVTIKGYRWANGAPTSSVVGTVPDRQMRAIQAGDANGDGSVDLVAGALATGLYLFEQKGDGWSRALIDADSSGYEHPVHLADLDQDGTSEVYVASEDQGELRRYVWNGTDFTKSVVMPLGAGDITWNVTDARL